MFTILWFYGLLRMNGQTWFFAQIGPYGFTVLRSKKNMNGHALRPFLYVSDFLSRFVSRSETAIFPILYVSDSLPFKIHLNLKRLKNSSDSDILAKY